jgi:hypothetical protein
MILHRNIIPFLFLLLVFAGCEDYVDIKTQGQLVPNQVENYRYLLNNTSALEAGPQFSAIASDDIALIDGSGQQQSLTGSEYYGYWWRVYTWQPVIYPLGNYQIDDSWNAMYNTIAYANTVIAELMDIEGDDDEKMALLAEAYVHRADAYLMLVNTYAKSYQASSASSDLGVPLVLKINTTQSLKRASIETVYNQIIQDLNDAIPYLPESQQYNTLPSLPSAYGELARTYLYMNNYAMANVYADSVLLYRNTLNNLGAIDEISTTTYPLRTKDPEILLSKVATGSITTYSPTSYRLSDDLLNVLEAKDQRYTLFTAPGSVVSWAYTDEDGRFFYRDYVTGESRNLGPNVPEMYLIKAEYYARNDNPGEAMKWVNELRKKRFRPEDYVEMTASDANDALVKVINERRREFFCRMLRWWDMRRLKNESLFKKTITRKFNGETYVLPPDGNRYVFPIPAYQIQLNPEIEQNPE